MHLRLGGGGDEAVGDDMEEGMGYSLKGNRRLCGR